MLRTFSKIHGLPALRLGWGLFPPAIADVLNRIRGPFNVSTPAIAAGIAAIEDQDWIKKSVAHNTQALALLTRELKALGLEVVPSQGNFLLAKFNANGAHTAKAANAHLLSEGIIVREVANYGLPDYLRITVGTEEENALLLASLRHFVSIA